MKWKSLLLDLVGSCFLILWAWHLPSGYSLSLLWPTDHPWLFDAADRSAFPSLWLTFVGNYTANLIDGSSILQTCGLFHLSACSLLPLWTFCLWFLKQIPQPHLQSKKAFQKRMGLLFFTKITCLIALLIGATRQFLFSSSLIRGLLAACFVILTEPLYLFYPWLQRGHRFFARFFLLLTFSFLGESPLQDWSFLLSVIGAHWSWKWQKRNKISGWTGLLQTQFLTSLSLMLIFYPFFPVHLFQGSLANLLGNFWVNWFLLPCILLYKIKPNWDFLFEILEFLMGVFYALMDFSSQKRSLKPLLKSDFIQIYLVGVLWFSWVLEDWQSNLQKT